MDATDAGAHRSSSTASEIAFGAAVTRLSAAMIASDGEQAFVIAITTAIALILVPVDVRCLDSAVFIGFGIGLSLTIEGAANASDGVIRSAVSDWDGRGPGVKMFIKIAGVGQGASAHTTAEGFILTATLVGPVSGAITQTIGGHR